MAAEMAGIHKGMHVYGSDGEDLGTIARIWTDVATSSTGPQDYLAVIEGGFLGIGERTLYIPLDAVEAVIPGKSVTVSCSRDQALDLHAIKPDGIKKKEQELAAIVASTTSVTFH